MKWLENLNSPYYHEVKFSKKYARFYKVTWKFTLPYDHEVKCLQK